MLRVIIRSGYHTDMNQIERRKFKTTNSVKLKQPVSIYNDPWESYNDVKEHGQLTLSNIEFTTTNLCNMRCSHCAVGYTLQTVDPEPLDMDLIYRRLDEIPNLRTMSITGGEPMFF